MAKKVFFWTAITQWPPEGAPEGCDLFWVRDSRGDISRATSTATRDSGWRFWSVCPHEIFLLS